jgi:hypothetical protein
VRGRAALLSPKTLWLWYWMGTGTDMFCPWLQLARSTVPKIAMPTVVRIGHLLGVSRDEAQNAHHDPPSDFHDQDGQACVGRQRRCHSVVVLDDEDSPAPG